MDRGLVQVYTGNGKGKTTAAIGQGIRACGSGNKVYMVQFLKTGNTGELETIRKLYPDFQIFRFEKKRGFFWNLDEGQKKELKAEVEKAVEFAVNVMRNRECDILILDEIMGVLGNGIINITDIVNLVKEKPECMELVLTGRNVPPEIVELADYVSEINAVKHPMEKGIGARKGIEF